MTNTREQAIAHARKVVTYPARYCARFTREAFGLGPLGDYDGDGAADAEDMWKASKVRHVGDIHPPAGVPVFWNGGSQDNGHAAVTDGHDREGYALVRSTDAWTSGKVGTVRLVEIGPRWGMTYLGWTEDLYGATIISEQAQLLDRQIAKWREKRALLKRRLARLRARRKALK